MVKDSINISKPVNCSLKLIQISRDEGWTKQLAFWHLERSNYGNLTIYNYRSRMPEIASKYGISTKTLYNYFNLLREKELIFDFKNHLSFKSIKHVKRELSDKRKTQISINPTDTMWTVQCRLYCKIIEHQIKKIAYKESIRNFERSSNRHDVRSGAGSFSLSYRNIAKLLNCQTDRAMKIIKTLKSLNIIKIHPSKPMVLKKYFEVNPKYIDDLPGYNFQIDGKNFIQFGNKIEPLEYPVILQKLTYKQYVKIYKSNVCKNPNNLNVI